MSRRVRTLYKVVTILAVVAILVCAGWIMLNRLGLSDGYDFGAGAYYYADIPDYENVLREDSFRTSLPLWVFILLFLAWGWLMWRLWLWVDRRGGKNKPQGKS